jgi:hypothetical protein
MRTRQDFTEEILMFGFTKNFLQNIPNFNEILKIVLNQSAKWRAISHWFENILNLARNEF